MRIQRYVKQALFFAPSVLIVACSADAGDVAKTGQQVMASQSSSTVDTGSSSSSSTSSTSNSPGNTSSTSSSTSGVVSTSSGTHSTSSTVVTTTSSSTSRATNPADASTMDGSGASEAGPPPAGCAAGATVIVMTVASGNSGNFMTLGPVCVELKGSVPAQWDVSNGADRMVTVTGSMTIGPEAANMASGGAIGPGADSYVYWNFTASATTDYTSVYFF